MNELNIRKIMTDGISYIRKLEGSDLFFGIDHCGDDLYEAKELFDMKHRIDRNRLIFVSYPDGEVFEPLRCEKGQYFSDPVFDEGKVFILKADFENKKLVICRCDERFKEIIEFTEIAMKEDEDCYNMRLTKSPVTLIKISKDNRFEILWPLRNEFAIDPREMFDHRIDEYLIFSKWYEDPDYREETLIRSYPDGELLGTHKGSIMRMENGEEWSLG